MLCHNPYGYSLLFYKVYHKEGECRQLEFWLEKEQILETYSAQLQKSRNSTKVIFGFNKNYWAKKVPEGAHTLSRRVGGVPPPTGCAPCLLGPLVALPCPSSAIWGLLPWKKLWASLRDETPPPRGGTNLELRQSCSTGDTSLREGEIITIVITNDPLIVRRSISIKIFTSTISSQTLVHLLYPILVSKRQIGTCGLLVVLITPCT